MYLNVLITKWLRLVFILVRIAILNIIASYKGMPEWLIICVEVVFHNFHILEEMAFFGKGVLSLRDIRSAGE